MPELARRIREFVDSAEAPVSIYDVGAVVERHLAANQSTPRQRHWRPTPVVIGVGIAALVAVLILQLVPGPEARPSSAAAATLARIATVAAEQPANVPGPGQYLYYRTTEENVGFSAGTQSFPLRATRTTQTWVATNGSGRQRITLGKPMVLDSADQQAWEAAGAPTSGMPAAGTTDTRFPSDSHVGGPLVAGSNGEYKLLYIDSSHFPTDSGALQGYLDRFFNSTGSATTTFLLAGEVLQEGASPALRVALFHLIEGLPGISLLGTVKDASGRSGVGVGLDDSSKGVHYVLVIDPHTSAVLGEETITGPDDNGSDVAVPKNTVLASTTFDSSGIVDSTTATP